MVIVVHVIVIVFPVTCTSVVGRINIDTVHLACVKVFQKLQCVVIVCLNERMPQITIWSIFHSIHWNKLWINGIAEFRHGDKTIDGEFMLRLICLSQAGCNTILNLQNGINIIYLSFLERNGCAYLDRDFIERGALRQMFFKH